MCVCARERQDESEERSLPLPTHHKALCSANDSCSFSPLLSPPSRSLTLASSPLSWRHANVFEPTKSGGGGGRKRHWNNFQQNQDTPLRAKQGTTEQNASRGTSRHPPHLSRAWRKQQRMSSMLFPPRVRKLPFIFDAFKGWGRSEGVTLPIKDGFFGFSPDLLSWVEGPRQIREQK